jgi:3D (Asp-Asp-Asp) domain-containing protein
LLAAAVTACVCLLMIAPASGTGPSGSIVALQADDANLAAQSRAAVLELYSLDERLGRAEQHVNVLDAAAARLRLQRGTLRRELTAARVDAHLSTMRLASRLRFIYEHGSANSLDVVMGAKSLEDALAQIDDAHRIAASNARVLLQVQSAKRHLIQLSTELRKKQHTLDAATAAANQQVAGLRALETSRQDYIAQIAYKRSLDAAQIAKLTAAAQAAEAKSQALAAAAATAEPAATALTRAPQVLAAAVSPPSTATSPSSGHLLTVVATAYDLPGRTATGLPVGWGVAAVDPSVIPLGTRIEVPGYGEAIAADTGGAIIGSRIDLWFPTAAQAYAWGRRTVTISVKD